MVSLHLFVLYYYSTNKVSSTSTHELDDTRSNDVPDRATWMFRKFPELRKLCIESSGDDEDDDDDDGDEKDQDNETNILKGEVIDESIGGSDVASANDAFDAVSPLNTNIDTTSSIDISNNEFESNDYMNSNDNLDVNESVFESHDEDVVLNQNLFQLNIIIDSNNNMNDEIVEVEPRRDSLSLRKHSILALSRIEELTAELNVNNNNNDDNDSVHWDDDGTI